MMRKIGLMVALALFAGLVFAATVSIDYGQTAYKTFELNDNEPLTVLITGVPAHVHGVFVSLDPSLDGKVYCAPGMVTHEANETWDAEFSCILLKGSYDGMLYFKPTNIDVDQNGNFLSEPRTTRLSLTVTEKQVWYTNYAYTGIGGTITVGPYTIKVEDSDVVSADITVQKGAVTLYAGVAFIGQELEVSDDFHLVFNGYSEKRGMAFFTIKTRFPVSVSSSSKQYYLVVSPVYYADETNRARVTVFTSCPKISVCDQNGTCKDYDVPDTHKIEFTVKVGEYTVKCTGSDLKETFDVKTPLVITKTVTKEVKQDPNQVCPGWFYSLSPASKYSYCSSVCGAQQSRPPAPSQGGGNSTALIGLVLVLLAVGYWYYRKKKGGSDFQETEKEVEAVPEVEG